MSGDYYCDECGAITNESLAPSTTEEGRDEQGRYFFRRVKLCGSCRSPKVTWRSRAVASTREHYANGRGGWAGDISPSSYLNQA